MTRSRALRRIALGMLVTLLVLIIGSGAEEVARYFQDILLVTALFTLVLLISGWLVARVFQLTRFNRWAVLFELPCRNVAIAAVVGLSVFNRTDLVRLGAALFVIQAVMLLVLTFNTRLRDGECDG